MPRSVARDDMIELGKPRPHARPQHQALLVRAQIVRQFIINSAAKLPNLGIAVDCLDDLFGTEGYQHADDDDSNFAGELAPAVQRLRKMKMHAAGPPADAAA